MAWLTSFVNAVRTGVAAVGTTQGQMEKKEKPPTHNAMWPDPLRTSNTQPELEMKGIRK